MRSGRAGFYSMLAIPMWLWALSWSPDGRYIVSGGGYAAGKAHTHDFTLHIWDTTTGTRLLKCTGHAKDVRAIRMVTQLGDISLLAAKIM